ncbi:MAG: 4-hydroxythreonine-4-phosphate dehydrogenase PdxA [Candidatus Omnitrophica bacterium CG23_combo_of_CG06-09_8_20_14_all_41_10]|uniref:4-hydroxythreonine-4-phosphate dehydrogenase PdxA n=1 Tax=Candidatus Sherwoodlollariibacterium unditelluris TaxID=1974757 RepID=A0A2G9YK10_9BACT|nr:MAG: 4-hydroxythreonine-4-phosphate dehydrogenase PdxA [Candidatus Omnitrophica bacterium CG23_combo_of_CG06-09_8_20_14_all_41_10]
MNSRKIPISKSRRIKVGITIGDPSGIGPAITIKAIRKLIDSSGSFSFYSSPRGHPEARRAEGPVDFVIIGTSSVLDRIPGFSRLLRKGVKIVDLQNVSRKGFEFGKIKGEYGRVSIEYLDRALNLLKKGAIDCLVTCPISKESINKAGFKYRGHTEYFAKRLKAKDVVMMLINKKLRFSLVTRHLAVKDVSGALSIDKICRVVSATYLALKKIFKISRPRIVLCGLNPHASDNGLIGDEEIKIIKPAVKNLKKMFKGINGPFSSDVAICRALKGEYDAVVAMYHDQASIPLKLTGSNRGVNLTLGLPFIRTSPLHGTAFDIAGRHKLADPNSLIAAIKLAVKCALG